MKRVIISAPFSEKEKKQISSLDPRLDCVFTEKENITSQMLSQAQALIGNVPPNILEKQPQLEWIQLVSSGADKYLDNINISKDTIITTATGAYGIGIAEYMVAMLLSMMKKIPQYLDDQKKGVWVEEGMVTTPYGKRILIVGTGNIGMEFAKRMRPFGCQIIGIRRRDGICPKELDEIYTMDALKEQLSLADVVAVCLPGTKSTFHLFDEEMLSCCKEGSYFMNVGRGNIIPLDAFLDEKISNRFAGIWLDVCEVEPLPTQHPLYYVPNLLITPHITGGFHLDLTMEKIFQLSLHNMKAWLGDGDYISVLDRATGYCK